MDDERTSFLLTYQTKPSLFLSYQPVAGLHLLEYRVSVCVCVCVCVCVELVCVCVCIELVCVCVCELTVLFYVKLSADF